MTRPAARGLLKARFSKGEGAWATWPKHVENKAYPPPEGEATLTFIGHSTFLIRLPGLNVITDPVFAQRCSPVGFAGPKRVRAPGMMIAALPRIDVILLSHNHYDHMDLVSLRAIRARWPEAAIVTMLGNAAYLAKRGLPGAVEIDWWERVKVKGAEVVGAPARHFAARSLTDRNRTLWGSFMLSLGGRRIYFGGDSGYMRFYKEIGARLGPADLALLPIGAYEPRWFMGPVHMNPADAVQAFLDLGAKRAVGMHFGTFQLTAEAIDAPVRELAVARAEAGVADEAFMTLDVGETMGV